MMNKDQELLKPCPFKDMEKELGHDLYICREESVQGLPRVGCTCGARGPLACGDDKSAIDAWNNYRRPAQEPRLERLDKESIKKILMETYEDVASIHKTIDIQMDIHELFYLMSDKILAKFGRLAGMSEKAILEIINNPTTNLYAGKDGATMECYDWDRSFRGKERLAEAIHKAQEKNDQRS